MIIPIKCFKSGKVIADKYNYYFKMIRKRKIAAKQNDDVIYFTEGETLEKTPEGITLDELGLTKICCRRHMLTHVDIE